MNLSNNTLEVCVLLSYFSIILSIVFFTYKKHQTGAEFILGNRSANFWLTALSAQASEMGGWLFLGYPALIFGKGLFGAWAAIGLVFGMFLNWHFIAPRLRTVTGQFENLTLNSYFESRFGDSSGMLRLISGLMSVVFFMIYISSGLVAMGILVESLLGINYHLGIVFGLFVAIGYVFIGGYKTVAWIDLFQGFFLLSVIVFVPLYLLSQLGGISSVFQGVAKNNLSISLLPDYEVVTFWKIIITSAGWGLGYFGQPHILTKFMGIRQASEMWKAKYVGISWLITALAAATVVGLIGIVLFSQASVDPQQIILKIVKTSLSPLFVALVLCAILAATTNVMAAHILVVASNISEDLYKCVLNRNASSNRLLFISRFSMILIALVSGSIAFFKPTSIYNLVLYAWSGLGASFGPLVLLSLFSKKVNKYGAFAGIFVGGITSAIWPYWDNLYSLGIDPIIPAFISSLIAIKWTSAVVKGRVEIPFES